MGWHDVKRTHFEEKMLWLMVLRRAIFDYVLYKGIRKRERDWKLSFQYIFQDIKCEEGLTFDEVCGLFGWHPEYLRRIIPKLTRADVKKLEAAKFKAEFLMDTLSEIANYNIRWSSGYAVPFFPPYNYTAPYRKALTPKKVQFNRFNWFVPMIEWEMSYG